MMLVCSCHPPSSISGNRCSGPREVDGSAGEQRRGGKEKRDGFLYLRSRTDFPLPQLAFPNTSATSVLLAIVSNKPFSKLPLPLASTSRND
jgi:hypothetical protein